MAFCGEVSKFFIIGFVLQTIALIIDIIGFASPYWIYSEESGIKGYAGLWKACTTISDLGQDVTNCFENPFKVLDWFKAVQAFACLGFICLLIAVVALAIKLCVDKTPLLYLSSGSTFAGAVCILISIAVYAAKITTLGDAGHFHFAFAFCIIAMILAIPAGIFIIIEGSK